MINISAEDAKLFQDNGFTKEQIGATINHYRQQGLSDDDIQRKINDRLSSFGKAPVEQKKGIDLTPRGIGNAIGNALAAPITAKRENVPLKEAFDINAQRTEDFNNEHKLGNAVADFALYAQLPVLKGAQGASALAKTGNFLANAAIQGGLPGLLEGAKEGNALEGAGAGTGIAAGVQSLPIVGKIAKPIMQVVPTTGNLLARTIGRIQPETLERAVQPDSKALDLTREQAQNLLMDTTERIQNTYNNLLAKRGKDIGEAVKKLRQGEYTPIKIDNIKDDIISIFNQYQGDKINPARNMTGSLENDLIDLVERGATVDLPSQQLKIIKEANPMLDDYHTGIRQKSDIKQFKDVIDDNESFVWGDFSREDAIKALNNGKATVYSSKPIENGNFVSTSKNQAKDYAGGGKIYSKEVPLEDVAWINGDEGQYAAVKDLEQILSPIDLQKAKEQVGKMVNWSDETSRQYKNPILEQLYGKIQGRLSNLSPELAQANADYALLRAFQKNEGLRRILKPGDNIDTASSALRNYNNTVTKGNTSRNIQDLEKLFINEGYAPFLNDIDDVNAAMDLLNARSTGDSWLANLTTQLSRPALKGVRYLNQKGIPEAMVNFSNKVSPEIRRLLTPALVQLGVGE